jgi:triphosphatase
MKVSDANMDLPKSAENAVREIELKLEIEPADAPSLGAIGLLRDLEPRSRRQLTIYYDRPDGLLQERGFTLRVRQVDDGFVQTVKPASESAGLMSRAEYEARVGSIEPDLAALADTPLAELAAAGKLGGLVPTIRSAMDRTIWRVEVGGSLVQLDFDQGEVEAGGRSQRFTELELELVSGDPACLFFAAKQIADQVPVRLGVLTKAERGARLASGAHKKIVKAANVAVDPSMTIAEAFEVIVHACIRQYRLNEPLVIGRRKMEALHQARVSMRRLRSALTLFKPAIRDAEYEYLRGELRWFTSQLGEARNLDVFLQRDLGHAERAALIERRELAYDHLIAVKDSRRFRLLMLEFAQWTAFGPWRSSKLARKPVRRFAGDRLDRLWGSISEAGRHLADLPEHDRHELRIQVKKMRYAIEFLSGLYPSAKQAQERFGEAVEELQESLGKLNDLAVARTLVDAGPEADEWLIGEPEQRLHLREAERAYRDLAAVGPFWRLPFVASA